MKKLLTLLLTLLLALSMVSFFACNSPNNAGSNSDNPEQEQPNYGGGENIEDDTPYTPTEGLAYELSSDGNYYICTGMGTATDTNIIIADEYNNLPVISISDFAFSGYNSLQSITIGNNVISIGAYAFSNSDSVQNISVPNNLQSIAWSAFLGCDKLKYNEYDNALYLGNNTNKYVVLVKATNINIASCEINPNTKIIYHEAFSNCNNLQYNEYDNAKYLGNRQNTYFALISALSNNITSCIIHTNTKIIGGKAFYFCRFLENIIIPNSIENIGSYAFSCCYKLKTIEIPNSVKGIGYCGFAYCSSLQQIKLGRNLQSIIEVFCCCESILSITVDENNQYFSSLEDNLYNKSKTTLIQYTTGKTTNSFIIPNSVRTIAPCAFYHCSYIENIYIPTDLTSIGYRAFEGCHGLQNIIIPDSVTSIGESAFYDCASLQSINYNGTKEQWNAISKGGNWNKYTSDYTIHCTDGDIA